MGQTAAFQLDGNGLHDIQTVPATVSAVASEVRDNGIRVELALDAAVAGAASLQHGQPGTVEITINKSTPAGLLMRVTGLVVGQPR